jgi:hypothetical protein
MKDYHIPKEIISTKKVLPYSSIQIYMKPSEYFEGLLSTLKVKEPQREDYKQKIHNVFPPAPNQKTIVSLSVRSAWVSYLKV